MARMITFHVKNFEKFQHYKDRSPPWIKLYNELLDDYSFGCLQDASKWHLIAIWLLASRSENKLPFDPVWIAKRINATGDVDLMALVEAGFIVADQPLPKAEQVASSALAECLPRERGETEGENISEAKASGAPPAAPPRETDSDNLSIPLWMVRIPDGDFARALWNQGLAFVAKKSGKSPNACRSLMGRWCKAAGDDHEWLWTKLCEAARDQRGEIVSWIEACLRAKGTETRPGLDPTAGEQSGLSPTVRFIIARQQAEKRQKNEAMRARDDSATHPPPDRKIAT